MSTKTTIALISLLVLAAGLWLTTVEAHPRYKNEAQEEGTNCAECHGDFDSATSPKGTVFPNNDKHRMHNGNFNMRTDCDLCHTSSDNRNPFIGSSDGTNDTPGRGCVGCHGREEDAGNDDLSPGRGAGLRQHHTRSGVMDCVGCHSDADPANYTPVGENVKPSYYGGPDTNADLPCNPDAVRNLNENWSSGDFFGLDNDGDLLYDVADGDCSVQPTTPGETAGPELARLTVELNDPSTRFLRLNYGVACQTGDNTIVYGPLAQVGSYGYSGQQCTVAATGSYDWTYPPFPDAPGSFFFLLVGNDATSEGSYGRRSSGTERPRYADNLECGLPQDLSNTCE